MTVKGLLTLLTAISALSLSGQRATAQTLTSVYAETDPTTCKPAEAMSFGLTYICPGPEGHDFLLGPGEHKVFVSYGGDPKAEIVWTQSLPGRHRIGDKLEWLMKDGKPVATILRYYIDRSAADLPDEQVLVVTKVSTGDSCHVAYVDALRNADANALARSAGETLVPGWSCADMAPRSIGKMEIHGFPQGEPR